ncbi:hypothetical protein [Kutzneria albida]|uniref:hypothetical protein n=1 Tax=Kutzneria albida TaxID=43357 RepID=UPI001F347F0F|nr:hypothetical protein [Kutzneria albida]
MRRVWFFAASRSAFFARNASAEHSGEQYALHLDDGNSVPQIPHGMNVPAARLTPRRSRA